MKVVSGRGEARWLPSRYNFALFRLYGYARIRSAAPEPADLVLVIDRHQSASENFVVGAWTTLTLAAYVTAILSRVWALPAAIAASIPAALVVMHLTLFLAGAILIRRGNNLRVNSWTLLLLLAAAALYFSRSATWARFVAWQFLAVLALNAIAAAVLVPLRGRIHELETSMGSVSSEV